MDARFNVERLEYCLRVSKSGVVCLDLVGGTTKKGSAYRNPCDDLFWDAPYFGDIDLGINALKVLKKVKRILLAYVFNTKPGRIGFAASTDRKVKIYRWFAKRLTSQMRNYNLVEYPAGAFNFYKLHKTA
jgi:hypothetical protein